MNGRTIRFESGVSQSGWGSRVRHPCVRPPALPCLASLHFFNGRVSPKLGLVSSLYASPLFSFRLWDVGCGVLVGGGAEGELAGWLVGCLVVCLMMDDQLTHSLTDSLLRYIRCPVRLFYHPLTPIVGVPSPPLPASPDCLGRYLMDTYGYL